jgi:hypothetical protein
LRLGDRLLSVMLGDGYNKLDPELLIEFTVETSLARKDVLDHETAGS